MPRSPLTPCTPLQPAWMTRCEAACAKLPRYPTSFALVPAPGKGEDKLVVECRHGEALWAVFDGHRSKEVSAFAARTFPQLVWSHPAWTVCPGEAVKESVRNCHELARIEGLRGGTTAVIVVTAGDFIYCASAGDSRVVAGLHGGGTVRMSNEHSTKSAEELARIQAARGNLEWGNLGGFLPITRGIGNFDLEAEGFSCVADVAWLPKGQVEFVVIASDGLWDVMNDEACCALVRQWGFQAAADGLARKAQQLGSADDIAVIIARFPVDAFTSPAVAHCGA